MINDFLETISIKGFKSIAALEKVGLRPINLIIGPNGSGKSNFIELFSFLHAIREGQLSNYVKRAGGANQVMHFGAKSAQKVEIDIEFEGSINSYHIILEPTADDNLYPVKEEVRFWDKEKGYDKPYETSLTSNGMEAGISAFETLATDGQVAANVRDRLAGWRLYHVHDTSKNSPLRQRSKLRDYNFLRPDGSNLSSFLYLLKNKYSDDYNLICRTIRQVAPFFDDFQLQPDMVNEEFIYLQWKHKNSDQYFNAASFSDGTLRFITLTVLLLQPKKLRPSIILVDEPELGLHPHAITLLAAMVKQVAQETQVILSTQSAQLLDHFDPEDVLVTERVQGSTQLKRLESSKLESWLEDYSLGQLWEKNEFGGRPGSE